MTKLKKMIASVAIIALLVSAFIFTGNMAFDSTEVVGAILTRDETDLCKELSRDLTTGKINTYEFLDCCLHLDEE